MEEANCGSLLLAFYIATTLGVAMAVTKRLLTFESTYSDLPHCRSDRFRLAQHAERLRQLRHGGWRNRDCGHRTHCHLHQLYCRPSQVEASAYPALRRCRAPDVGPIWL